MKVVDLGLRDTMNGEQILSEVSKWKWESFVLVGWIKGPETEDGGSKDRLAVVCHPDTYAGDILILSEIIKKRALEELIESHDDV